MDKMIVADSAADVVIRTSRTLITGADAVDSLVIARTVSAALVNTVREVVAQVVTPFLAGAGLALACVLILAERTGKAVRSPAKTALLAHAAGKVGLGRGFAVHKVLDQAGAIAGPLLVAAVAGLAGTLWPALAILIVPGVAALLILIWIRHRTGDPLTPAEPPLSPPPAQAPTAPKRTLWSRSALTLPRSFWLLAAAASSATAGLVTFGVISFHLTRDQVVPVATIPLIYAAAMAAAALAALATGWLFDRIKGRVLLVLPFLIAAVPPLAFTNNAGAALVGVIIWGSAVGVQDSTVKALVADRVPASRRATAYGAFAAVQGAAAALGGTMAGALYEHSLPALISAVVATQLSALVLLIITLRRNDHRASLTDGLTNQNVGS